MADAVIRLPVPVTAAAVRIVAERRAGKQRSSSEGEIEDTIHADSERVERASTKRGTGQCVLGIENVEGSQWGAVSCIVGRLSKSQRDGKAEVK
jgi:hypothetical protein